MIWLERNIKCLSILYITTDVDCKCNPTIHLFNFSIASVHSFGPSFALSFHVVKTIQHAPLHPDVPNDRQSPYQNTQKVIDTHESKSVLHKRKHATGRLFKLVRPTMCKFYAHTHPCGHTHTVWAAYCTPGQMVQRHCASGEIWQTLRMEHACADCGGEDAVPTPKRTVRSKDGKKLERR